MSRLLRLRAAVALIVVAGLAGAGCGGDSKPTGPPAVVADVVIEIVANNGSLSFSPNPGVARVGQTVAWHNALGVTHTATADGGGFDTGDIAGGATSAPITLGTAGSFPYRCNIHPTMVGTLTVNP